MGFDREIRINIQYTQPSSSQSFLISLAMGTEETPERHATMALHVLGTAKTLGKCNDTGQTAEIRLLLLVLLLLVCIDLSVGRRL